MDIRLQKVINFFKEDAPTMSMSGGGIAGSAEAGDDPPVRKKKKKKRKRTPVGRYGSRRFWSVSYTHLTLPTTSTV